MAVSFVNGYLCTSSCDAAKAKHGVDPHQQTDGVQNDPKTETKTETKNGVVTEQSAVTFGGSLSHTTASTGATTSASPSQPGVLVNRLA